MINYVDIDTNNVTENIQEVFLGRKVKDVHFVVLTPLQNIYIDLFNMFNCEKEITNGFYRNAIFREDKSGILICCSQGAAAQDIIYLFSNVQMIFFGYAGSLIEDISIGSVVEVAKIIDEAGEIYPLANQNMFNSVMGAYSPCFLGEMAKTACSLARQRGAVVVDMETVHCAKAAIINNNSFSACLLITDIPENTDVWSVDKKDTEKIKIGYNRALDVIRKNIVMRIIL